MLLKITEV